MIAKCITTEVSVRGRASRGLPIAVKQRYNGESEVLSINRTIKVFKKRIPPFNISPLSNNI